MFEQTFCTQREQASACLTSALAAWPWTGIVLTVRKLLGAERTLGAAGGEESFTRARPWLVAAAMVSNGLSLSCGLHEMSCMEICGLKLEGLGG